MSAIKERPILFSAPMVRAILEGRKTVTRRAVKGFQIPTEDTAIPIGDCQRWSAIGQRDPRYGFCVFGSTEAECAKELEQYAPCPHGRRGDRLWVRETHSLVPDPEEPAGYSQVLYAADGQQYGKNRPSIHMFRADSRILLEITDVRVERLQDITYEQAAAEGVHRGPLREWCASDEGGTCHKYPVPAFRDLWQSVGGNWDANPWVWVVEFKRVTP